MKDSHVHTTISHDGKSSIEEYESIAKEKGIDEITLTEHYDIYDGIDTDLKTINLIDYYKEYLKHKDSDIKINFGIEMGLQPDLVDKIESDMLWWPFDIIIGSSHITCKKDIAMDPSFFEGLTRREAYLNYFKEVLENIKLYRYFNVYGHLDYIVRYGGYAENKIDYNEFKEILDEILSTLIKRNKGIEINTSGIRYGLNSPHPNIEILKRYKELGGEIITVGSDAHIATDLGRDFDIAYDMLEEAGFNEVATFHERIPYFEKINTLRRKGQK